MKLQETRKHLLLSLFIALVFALTIYPTKAQAQIIGQLDVNVPFQFHAGNTKFPSGKYFIHLLDDSDLTVMLSGARCDRKIDIRQQRDFDPPIPCIFPPYPPVVDAEIQLTAQLAGRRISRTQHP